MSAKNKTFWDINTHARNHLQKVNFRQYLTNKREPAIESSGLTSTRLDEQAGIIDETYNRKRALRKFASRLRLG